MRLVGKDKLDKFARKHANAKQALLAWKAEVSSKQCQWKTTHDVKHRYQQADFLAGNRVIFNIKGNDFRLVVKVRYEFGVVLVEWVGTHAEYSKKKF